jgi:hypothetical protein
MKYANHHGYSDVEPFEVVRVVSEKTIEVREMTAEQDMSVKPTFTIGGFSAHSDNAQKWDITSNPANPVIKIRLQKNGQWRDAHKRRFVLADAPRKFYDYNF